MTEIKIRPNRKNTGNVIERMEEKTNENYL